MMIYCYSFGIYPLWQNTAMGEVLYFHEKTMVYNTVW